MPTYKSPIRPYDPVIEQPGTRVFQYLRDNFYGAGQDSFTKPFGQNQELFELCQNVMPIAQGSFRLRHGYSLLVNPNITTISRISAYQNIATGARKLIYISSANVVVSNEDGSSLSTITTANPSAFRTVTSRDYAFFPTAISPVITWPSGQQSDGKKWHSTNGLSDWGLAQPASSVNVTSVASAGNITLASTVGRVYAGAFLNSTTGHYSDINVGLGSFASNTSGPSFPTTSSQLADGTVSWSGIGNIFANDGVRALAVLNGGDITNTLKATGFGFAIPGTATIYGITVNVNKIRLTGSPNTDLATETTVKLLNAGTAVGSNHSDGMVVPTTATTSMYGGATDLWGATWTPADINNATFGVALKYTGDPNNLNAVSVGIDYVTITITYATGAGANTGAITSKQVALSLPTANPPTGADKFVILSTLDGGDTSTFYVVDTVPVASTTYTDNTPDNVLVTKNRATEVDEFGQEHGLIDNQMPPLGLLFPTKHRGRVFGAIGDTLYFSKNLDDITTSTGLVLGRYEEAWPATNTINISTTKETIRGLLSDGNTLYIGTERHIWRLDGDGPLNFSKPEIVFNEVGLSNQDTWQIVFAEGQPVGMIWMTPDSRVILGNFAHYQDIGTPIQDILDSQLTPSVNPIWAAFYSRQEFDIYALAICASGLSTKSPDMLCIYDMRGGKWFIWKPTDPLTAGYFNIDANGIPQWLIASEFGLIPSTHGGKIYQFSPTATQDRVGDTPVSFTASIRTPWMHLGQPTAVKALNEIEVITGDNNLLLTVEGASKSSQVGSPNSVISNATLATSPRGFLKLYLAGSSCIDRFYRFTFNSSNSIQDVLQGYTIEAFPVPY